MDPTSIPIILAMAPGGERDTLAEEFSEQGCAVNVCGSGDCVMDRARAGRGPLILLLDTDLSGPDTERLLEALRETGANLAPLLITDRHTANMAGVWAELGAWGYLLKPLRWGRLALYLERIAAHFTVAAERDALRAFAAAHSGNPPRGVFISPAMKTLLHQAREAAQATGPVLITGEPGTDKHPLAWEIHTHGPGRSGPFVPVNCAALAPGDLDGALFGVTAQDTGGHTPAHPGALTCAHGGTLFLDEITGLSAHAQERLAALLSGGSAPLRVVAATSANIALELGGSRFDSDLYRVFESTTLRVPALRDRTEDIPELARQALVRAGLAPGRRPTLTDDAAEVLATYYWPGNERELCIVVERAAMRASGQTLEPQDILPLLSRSLSPAPAPAPPPPDEYAFPILAVPLCEVEKAYIGRVLRHFSFHRERTAASLGITRKTLYSKIKLYDLIDHIVRQDADQQSPPE